MRIFDTERLLPAANNHWVRDEYKGTYREDLLDSDCELSYAVNGAGPVYMAAALMALIRATAEEVTNRIAVQVSPLTSLGLTTTSYSYKMGSIYLHAFCHTYLWPWRDNGANINGIVVTNPVPGHGFEQYNKVKSSKLFRRKRGARFKGAFATATPTMYTPSSMWIAAICGAYDGVSNEPGYRDWDSGARRNQGDLGSIFTQMAGMRSDYIYAPAAPCQLAKPFWNKMSRMLRAYTSYVVSVAGSSPDFDDVTFLANGCWEQIYATEDAYMRRPSFSASLTDTLTLGARGLSKVHMVDALDLFSIKNKLTNEVNGVNGWNGSHANFAKDAVPLTKQELTGFNGVPKGPLKFTIPYFNTRDSATIAFIAKIKNVIGGYRRTFVEVPNAFDKKNVKTWTTTKTGGVPFNGMTLSADKAPFAVTVGPGLWQNYFVIDAGVNSPTDNDLYTLMASNTPLDQVSDKDLSAVTAHKPPPSRVTYDERQASKQGMSIETFPNSAVKDEGLLGEITSIVAIQDSNCIRLTIHAEGQSARSTQFMPIATLLVQRPSDVIESHNARACGNYGYGFIEEDPFSPKGGVEIINTAPAATAYAGQERWHVPYKNLIAESWRTQIGDLTSSNFSQQASALPSPLIEEAVSGTDSRNRYTSYDLQVRPPTFLPLFMCAEVCHQGGADSFSIALSRALIALHSITVGADGYASFAKEAPVWATDKGAYYASILALIRLGGIICEGYKIKAEAPVKVALNVKDVIYGSPSDDFWLQLAESTGLKSVSDLITHFGVKDGIAMIPNSVLIVAALRDPIKFGASMGIRVIKHDDKTYQIGSTIYADLEAVSLKLVDCATIVITNDKSNVRNILTASGISDATNVIARPKKYIEGFNWALLIPHLATAVTGVTSKIVEKNKRG